MTTDPLIWEPRRDSVVRDRDGGRWHHRQKMWRYADGGPGLLPWRSLLDRYGPLTLISTGDVQLGWQRLPTGEYVCRQYPIRLIPPTPAAHAVDETGEGWEEPRGQWTARVPVDAEIERTGPHTIRPRLPQQWSWSTVEHEHGEGPVVWDTLAAAQDDINADPLWFLRTADTAAAGQWANGPVDLLEHAVTLVQAERERARRANG